MKKIICLIPLALIMLAFNILTIGNISFKAKATSSTPLLSPFLIEVIKEDIFVYDTATETIYKREISKKSTPIEASKQILGVKMMHKTSSDDLLLFINDNGFTGFKLASNGLNSVLDVSLSKPSYRTDMVADFTLNGNSGYILKTNGEINSFSLTGANLTFTGTITQTDLNILNEGNITLSHILKIDEDNVILASKNELFNLEISSEVVTKLNVTLPEEIVSLDYNNGNLYILTSSNVVSTYIVEQNIYSEKEYLGYNFNYLNVSDAGNVYLSSPATHQLFMANGETLTDLNFNENIIPDMYSKDKLRYFTAKNSVGLFLQPYSLTPSITLPTGSNIVVIGEAPAGYNHYYCMYNNQGTLAYFYLKKDAPLQETIVDYTCSVNLVAIRKTSVYSYPSTIVGSNNVMEAEIPAGVEISSLASTIIKGVDNKLYYLVSYDDAIGYAQVSCLQTLNSAIELSLKCNGKTKRETTLFENADGTGKIISLPKNTRINITEELSPNKDYTKCEYEAENGVIYTGFIFTDDIDPDGLSTLQILGITLIGVNLFVVSLILVVRQKAKKWQHIKQH